MSAELLEPLKLLILGSLLVEASAGTGKTYTIAAEYLRLVLGHGVSAAFLRPLTPPEILVVTYTDAATRELRDRIRARLTEAAAAFLMDPAKVIDQPQGTDLLHDLRADYPPDQWPRCARLLNQAAEWMDEAAISTIHSWCNRMLSEHAFASGSLFTQTLETDTRELEEEVICDYWRIHFAHLSVEDADQVRNWWKDPATLLEATEDLQTRLDALPAAGPPARSLEQARAQARSRLDGMKQPWRGEQGWAEELLKLIQAAITAKQIPSPRNHADWMRKVREWAEGEAPIPVLTATAWERLTPATIGGSNGNPDQALVDHPGLKALSSLRNEVAALPTGKDQVLIHAAGWFVERFAAEQQARGQMGFDELLKHLDAALAGPNGEALARIIREQFPVALIDEFQDTDPLQYRIFDAIYGVARNDQETALILIGDPKQAIYAFRGADIYTYLEARRATQGRHSTLGTNFRSSQAMVEAVNHVFAQAEARPGGAFGIERDGQTALPFQPVAAHGREEQWEDGPDPAPALTFWRFEETSKSAAQQRVAESCASEVVRLLNADDAGFRLPTGDLQRVKPSDIAILVNNGFEASSVRDELRQRGVRSVYLSDRGSVMTSPVTVDIQRWLAACAEPTDQRTVRAALATATLDLTWNDLDRLQQDELAWDREVLRFRGYRDLWQRQGVLPMLRRLIHDFQVPARLMALGDERRLTDLLHIAEWLQQASSEIEGEHALLRHFVQACADPKSEDAARRVRLESDEGLVKVVTVHKSKGLEYPLVFLPFGITHREIDTETMPIIWHDEIGRTRVTLTPDQDAAQRANAESLAEDVRKLYVALTRARHALWMGAGTIKKVNTNALLHLADGPLSEVLPRWAADCPHIAAIDLPEPSDTNWCSPARPPRSRMEPALPTPRPHWWIASYSALRVEDNAASAWLSTAEEDVYAEGLESGSSQRSLRATPASTSADNLHGFPGGAEAGTFLHALLEWAGQRRFAVQQGNARTDLDDFVARRCNLAGLADWIAPLRRWLAAWGTRPLDLSPLVPGLAPIAPIGFSSLQVEMEFWFAANTVRTLDIDVLVSAGTLGGAPRPALRDDTVNGMLKGFIDLVFECDGRFFVGDYKSNWLGDGDGAYAPDALRAAVLEHRYDLQYTIYLLALHRLLKQRLPNYDYEQHIGGAVYFFLRGQDTPGGGLHCERPPRQLIESLDKLFCGAAFPRDQVSS